MKKKKEKKKRKILSIPGNEISGVAALARIIKD